MAVRCEVARCQLFLAAVCVRDGRHDADLQLDSAKLLANGAALHNVDWNIQLHGGIGVMDEHDAHLYMKRARLLSHCFGSDAVLLDRIVDAPIVA
jgi:alkylation response protein AidB-like acyl-CoA dehydrogenase